MILPGLFPDGRRAALSLTYDDGAAQHLDVVMPDLEAVGLRGTFYVHTRQDPGSAWHTRRDEWRAAAGRGHEIGNHTQYHPCGKHFDWIKPNFSLEAYGLGRMEAELVAASRDLDEAVGPSPMRSFAYTCGEEFVGPEHTSFRPLADRLFPASRAGRDVSADLWCDTFFNVTMHIRRVTNRPWKGQTHAA
jgi:peptidoglycan/xylan/chitin deacetylase (PgdA/CDA1 family)